MGNNIFILLVDTSGIKTITFRNGMWVEADTYDVTMLQPHIEKKYNVRSNDNELIGFMDYDKTDNIMVFKIRDMTVKRASGARCDQSSKTAKIKNLNTIFNDKMFTSEKTKGMVQQELLIYQKFMLRYSFWIPYF